MRSDVPVLVLLDSEWGIDEHEVFAWRTSLQDYMLDFSLRFTGQPPPRWASRLHLYAHVYSHPCCF
jgi:hypothetical protein